MEEEIKIEADRKVVGNIIEQVKGRSALEAISNVGFAARALIEAMGTPLEKRAVCAILETIITNGLPSAEEMGEE